MAVQRPSILISTVLLICGLILNVAVVHAASLRITPLVAEVPAGSTMVTYKLRNGAAQAIGVQITAFDWQQPHGEDELVPTDDLMIVPKVLSIPPGRQQLVRVALRAKRPARELSYRLHFQELPTTSGAGTVAIKTLLKLNMPLFFSAPEPRRSYDVRLERDNAGIFVALTNTGSRYLRFSGLILQTRDGDSIGERSGLMYVLPGATQRWRLEAAEPGVVPDEGNRYQLQLTSGATSDKLLLELE